MEFYDLIRKRYSVRDYENRPVSGEVLNRILEAGRLAPSAANRQPWRFIIVSSPELLERVFDCYAGKWIRTAPHVLVVAGKRQAAWTRKWDDYNSLETDLTIAMDHLILAAANEDVGTCWIAAFHPDRLSAALNLAPDEEVFAITPLGYPRGGYPPKSVKQRKDLDEIVEFR